jgi:hypothetical protein
MSHSPYDLGNLITENKKFHMLTFTGKHINPFEITPDDIDIEDIAQSLSKICRFGGHIKHFYTVAQHSVYVSLFCNPENALYALLHDATEAYFGDIIRPLKYREEFKFYREAEDILFKKVLLKFGLDPYKEIPDVWNIDNGILINEKMALSNTPDIQWDNAYNYQPVQGLKITEFYSPELAYAKFISRFNELTK